MNFGSTEKNKKVYITEKPYKDMNMNMKISAVLLIALIVSLPLIQAQEQGEVVTDEVIPEDIAEALTGVGSGPAIPFILDIIIAPILDIFFTIVAIVIDIFDTCCLAYGVDFLDTVVAWVADFIDTVIAMVLAVYAALWGKGFGTLLSPIAACCTLVFTGCGILPWDSYLMLLWHCCDYVPFVACLPHAWSAVRSCFQCFSIL